MEIGFEKQIIQKVQESFPGHVVVFRRNIFKAFWKQVRNMSMQAEIMFRANGKVKKSPWKTVIRKGISKGLHMSMQQEFISSTKGKVVEIVGSVEWPKYLMGIVQVLSGKAATALKNNRLVAHLGYGVSVMFCRLFSAGLPRKD